MQGAGMALPQRRLRPRDYGRCTKCGKLTEKASLSPGPEGGMFGPECIKAAIREWNERMTTQET